MDLNPDGVIRPFIFEPQHSSSLGEEEISVDEETQKEIQEETSSRSRLVYRECCSCGNCQEMPSELPSENQNETKVGKGAWEEENKCEV